MEFSSLSSEKGILFPQFCRVWIIEVHQLTQLHSVFLKGSRNNLGVLAEHLQACSQFGVLLKGCGVQEGASLCDIVSGRQ